MIFICPTSQMAQQLLFLIKVVRTEQMGQRFKLQASLREIIRYLSKMVMDVPLQHTSLIY